VLESTVEYPIGHKRRRGEALPMLEAKFKRRLAQCFSPERCQAILDLSLDQERFEKTLVDDYLDHFVV
jgi:2-methylcitrate dehydratase